MQERRRFHRYQVYRLAKLVGQTDVLDCVVRDISINGARLALVSTAGIPDTIDLSFELSTDSSALPCGLAHADGNRRRI